MQSNRGAPRGAACARSAQETRSETPAFCLLSFVSGCSRRRPAGLTIPCYAVVVRNMAHIPSRGGHAGPFRVLFSRQKRIIRIT